MKLKEKGKLKYFVFESFEKTGFINHCFSTRCGGVSSGCYESLNLGFREDSPENVRKNYDILLGEIGCESKNVVFSNQVHKDEIFFVSRADCGKGLFRESDIKGKDALVTNEPEVVLVTFYADCVPIYIADTKRKVIALAHSGWRGTVKQISKKTIEAMHEKYGCESSDIIAGIGPSIGKCCFETDYPPVKEFEENLPFSKEYIEKRIIRNENGDYIDKYYINLQAINKQILINAGVSPQNIEVADICTKCHPELFFSHRYMGEKRGTMAAIMSLKV